MGMKRDRIIAAGLAVALLSLTSCAAMQENPNTTKGVAYGTLGGAALGAGIGALAGGGKGAAIGAGVGAGVGALSGGLIGSYMDRQERELRAIWNEQAATNDRITRAEDSIQMTIDSDTMFDTGSSTIYPGGRDRLMRVGQSLNRNPRTDIMVVGHTDDVGSDAMNQRLSEDRARAVANVLVNAGVDPARIRTRGDGESTPVATNASAEGRSRNRRVEVFVTPNQGLQNEAGRVSIDTLAPLS
jgi:outer membrane protein OmpA-like peptidoglycan-associated protein